MRHFTKRNRGLHGCKYFFVIVAGYCLMPILTTAQQPTIDPSLTPIDARPASPAERTVPMSATDERYRIGPGDVLEVMVYNHPQLSRPALRVDGRGMIRMPLLEGEIQAACKTESGLARELTERYEKYQKYPQVDVYVKEFNSQPVAIVGAVNAPGRFQLQRRIRLLELLTFAGGPNANAGRTIQIVHGASAQIKICGGETLIDSIDDSNDMISFYKLNETLAGDEPANPFVTPGDVVTIPDAEQIYVIGNVPRPSAIALKEPLTLSRAIVMAGGTLPNTEKTKIRILRQAHGSSVTSTVLVNLKEINNGGMADIALLPNDVVEVPRQGGFTMAMKTLMNTIVPTIAGLPTRIVY
jgi:polysaccharide biosynthesis/export protein